MLAPQLQSVQFYNDTIHLIEDGGQPFAPIKPICENIGIDPRSQRRKMTEEKERWNWGLITSVAEDGKAREMFCLPLRKLNGWLMTISPARVKHEIRDRLIQYQNECDEALWNYWTKEDQLLLTMENDAIDAACAASAAATMALLQRASHRGYSAKFLADLIRYCSAGLSHAEIGKLLGVSKETALRYGRMALAAGLVSEQSGCRQLSLFPEV